MRPIDWSCCRKAIGSCYIARTESCAGGSNREVACSISKSMHLQQHDPAGWETLPFINRYVIACIETKATSSASRPSSSIDLLDLPPTATGYGAEAGARWQNATVIRPPHLPSRINVACASRSRHTRAVPTLQATLHTTAFNCI